MNDPAAVFPALSAILRRHAQGMTIRTDERGHLYVELAPVTARAKTRFFGAVQVRKSYVSYHLMPVYENPALLEGVASGLLRRMQGRSCFNFTTVDASVLGELDALTGRCAGAVRG